MQKNRKPKPPMVDPSEEDFGTVCICAVRYSLGRQSYMPGLVQDFIRPHLPQLTRKSLSVLERDIAQAEEMGYGYGHPTIDKPGWLRFLNEIREELKRREEKATP